MTRTPASLSATYPAPNGADKGQAKVDGLNQRSLEEGILREEVVAEHDGLDYSGRGSDMVPEGQRVHVGAEGQGSEEEGQRALC